MHRSIRFLTPLILFAGFVGLVHAADELPSTTPYYPLAVGTTWHYKAGENRYQVKVTKIENVGNTPAARLELIVNGKAVSHEHVSVTKDTVVRLSSEGKEARPPIVFLKLPPKPGESWDVDSKVDNQPLKGKFTVGKEEKVKVPAGTYSTITVTGTDMEANGVKITLKYYFAEKVGMVKQELTSAGQKVTIELEKLEQAK